jgi:hypothetical protein
MLFKAMALQEQEQCRMNQGDKCQTVEQARTHRGAPSERINARSASCVAGPRERDSSFLVLQFSLRLDWIGLLRSSGPSLLRPKLHYSAVCFVLRTEPGSTTQRTQRTARPRKWVSSFCSFTVFHYWQCAWLAQLTIRTWLRPGLEIAFAIPTSTDQRPLRS